MNIKDSFRDLSRFERRLWLLSVSIVALAFALSGFQDVLTLVGSLIGVTSLIFFAKGYVLGQLFTIVFSIFYGMISFYFRYYGEMLTYLCMTLPMAVIGAVSWLRHPFPKTAEVEVNTLTKRQAVSMAALTVLVTAGFYFILKALNNANLAVSTISIATSFAASCLTYYRSPYYAVAYAANDVVLIVLWILAAKEDRSYLPMVACFAAFLLNDSYAFYNWRRMKRRQAQYRCVNGGRPDLPVDSAP